MRKNLDNLFTSDETAKFLRISQRSLFKYSQLGMIKYLKPAGKRLYRMSAIEKFLENNNRSRKDA